MAPHKQRGAVRLVRRARAGRDMNRQTTIDELVGQAHARRTDPDTSHHAAHQLSSKQTMMRALLNVFNSSTRGFTAEQACIRAGYDASSGAWKRVSDLKRQGLIRATGATDTGASGRQQDILAITETGKGAL